jgi:hypothetical protein
VGGCVCVWGGGGRSGEHKRLFMCVHR